MAIDGSMRQKLQPGMRLVAKYKGDEHSAEVVEREGGKIGFRLSDGREFNSPSAAGSAVMNGQACNGWRFWSLEGEQGETQTKPAKPTVARDTRGKGKLSKGGSVAAAKAKPPRTQSKRTRKPELSAAATADVATGEPAEAPTS